LESARLSRAHNDANVLSMGQRLITLEMALDIVKIWLATAFEGGRHEARIRQIE
jgi:ribose 5-phosphate isomerase B